MQAPSLKSYLELPIQVQHRWDAYPTVDRALMDLEIGNFLQAALLSDAVYTDDRVTGVITTRINAITGLPMEFKWQGQDEATGEDDDQGDEIVELKKRIVEKCEQQWERMLPSAALKELIRWDLLLNLGVGELLWTWDEDDEWMPVLKSWNPQFVYWRYDTRSYWLIHTAGQLELNPGGGRWVLLSSQGHNHGWLYGLIRALGKLWLDRVFTFRDWSRLEEKLGLGVLLADVPADASADDKKAFANAVADPPGETTLILPGTKNGKFDLRMMETTGSSNSSGVDAFKERIKQLDTSIAVCVLGQNLSTEISGSSGSRAAAKVHDNVRGDYLKADVQALSSVIKTQILTPWVKYNWAEDAKRLGVRWQELVPNVTWKVDPPEDKKETAAAIAAISLAIPGLVGTPADIRKLLDDHGIPVMDEAATSDQPPPAAVNERPREPEDPLRDSIEPKEMSDRRRAKARSKGAELGQRQADAMASHFAKLSSEELGRRRKELMEIIKTSSTYEEVRKRVKELYLDFGPGRYREIVEMALVKAELVGRISSHEDRA